MATNIKNGKKYIGRTKFKIEKRKYEHLYNAIVLKSNLLFHKAIRKYGVENFKWEVLCKCDSKEHLIEMEKYYIEMYNTYGSGYNMNDGGDNFTQHKKVEKEKKVQIPKVKKLKIIKEKKKQEKSKKIKKVLYETYIRNGVVVQKIYI